MNHSKLRPRTKEEIYSIIGQQQKIARSVISP